MHRHRRSFIGGFVPLKKLASAAGLSESWLRAYTWLLPFLSKDLVVVQRGLDLYAAKGEVQEHDRCMRIVAGFVAGQETAPSQRPLMDELRHLVGHARDLIERGEAA